MHMCTTACPLRSLSSPSASDMQPAATAHPQTERYQESLLCIEFFSLCVSHTTRFVGYADRSFDGSKFTLDRTLRSSQLYTHGVPLCARPVVEALYLPQLAGRGQGSPTTVALPRSVCSECIGVKTCTQQLLDPVCFVSPIVPIF